MTWQQLILEDISIGYSVDDVVASGIGFSFQRGRAYLLQGKNGCGKSTLLRTIAGLLEPIRGRIIPSVHLDNWRRECRGVFLCSEDIGRFYGLTCGEVVARIARRRCGFQWKSERKSLPIRVFDEKEWRDVEKKRVKDLSGGQGRLVDIICAMIGGADLLLLDEMLAGLDNDKAERVTRVLIEFVGCNRFLIATEHRAEIPLREEFEVVNMGAFKLRREDGEAMELRADRCCAERGAGRLADV